MLKDVFLWFAICSLVHGKDIPPPAKDIADISDRDLILQLVHRVNRLEEDNGIQQKQIEELEASIERQAAVIDKLERNLEERVKDSENESEAEIDADAPDVKLTDKRQEHLLGYNAHQRIRQVASTNRPPVAFSALLGQRDTFHLGIHQNLVFEVENVDTSHAYSTNHGVFTAPVSGIYFISASVLAQNGREVWCDVVVNGAIKGRVYARGTVSTGNDQGSITILLHLKQGDEVAVQNEATDGAVYGELYTSFSGFLLFEEEFPDVVG